MKMFLKSLKTFFRKFVLEIGKQKCLLHNFRIICKHSYIYWWWLYFTLLVCVNVLILYFLLMVVYYFYYFYNNYSLQRVKIFYKMVREKAWVTWILRVQSIVLRQSQFPYNFRGNSVLFSCSFNLIFLFHFFLCLVNEQFFVVDLCYFVLFSSFCIWFGWLLL